MFKRFDKPIEVPLKNPIGRAILVGVGKQFGADILAGVLILDDYTHDPGDSYGTNWGLDGRYCYLREEDSVLDLQLPEGFEQCLG